MEQDQPPPPYTHRNEATFAQVVLDINKSTEIGPEFQDALAAFRGFLAKQENVTLSKWVQYVLFAQYMLVLIYVYRKRSTENT